MYVTYQEDDGDVETECDHGVGEEGEHAHVVDVLEVHSGDLDDQRYAEVHDGADGGKVVERYQRVHLVFCRAQ